MHLLLTWVAVNLVTVRGMATRSVSGTLIP